MKLFSEYKTWILFFVLIAVYAIFAFLMYLNAWTSDDKLEKMGQFGDSFGLLTSLFNGLALFALALTVSLQKKELTLQREELSKNTEAQETQAKLQALTAILNQYNYQIKSLDNSLKDSSFVPDGISESQIRDALQGLYDKRYNTVQEIQKILKMSGVDLETDQ